MEDTSEDEEDFSRPRYSTILYEEEYEDENDDAPTGTTQLQDNFEADDPTPQIIGWDPRTHHEYYFRIQ